MDNWLQKLQSKLPTLIVSILFAPTRWVPKSNIMRVALGIGLVCVLFIVFWPNSSPEVVQRASDVAQETSDSETANAPRNVLKDCPLQVETYIEQILGNTDIYLRITSLVDSITILGIKLNRGNCAIRSVSFPIELKYGETHSRIKYYCKKVLEAEIKTDKGICILGFRP